MKYFNYCQGLTMTSEKFAQLFGGPPREPETLLTPREMDLARSLQDVTEEIVLRMARHVRKQTGQRYLCLAGGVALNCVANGKLLRSGIFDDLWIQPAAGDAGGAVGAAYVAYHHYLGHRRAVESSSATETLAPGAVSLTASAQGRDPADGDSCVLGGTPNTATGTVALPAPKRKRDRQHGSYLGPEYSNEEIRSFLLNQALPHRFLKTGHLLDVTTDLLMQEKVIGWFQGRMEFGPRALGNRSILGDPRSPEMQKKMNLKIKFREGFRPFAPSTLGVAPRVQERGHAAMSRYYLPRGVKMLQELALVNHNVRLPRFSMLPA